MTCQTRKRWRWWDQWGAEVPALVTLCLRHRALWHMRAQRGHRRLAQPSPPTMPFWVGAHHIPLLGCGSHSPASRLSLLAAPGACASRCWATLKCEQPSLFCCASEERGACDSSKKKYRKKNGSLKPICTFHKMIFL